MASCCKVGKAIDRYDLKTDVVSGDLNDYLVARWNGHNEFPKTGLQTLTDYFNLRILKKVYTENNRRTVDTQVESDYEALTGDDEIAKDEIITDLERDGIDGEQLASDFISKTTLYRHFNNCLDTEKEGTNEKTDSNWEAESIQYALNNALGNSLKALKSLENKGKIPHATKAEVSVPLMLSCPKCTTRVRFKRAIDRGYICKEHMSENSDLPDELSDSTSTETEEDEFQSSPV